MENNPILESTDPLWFCLKTQAKHEKLAAQCLRTRLGLEVFSPLLRFQRATVTGKKWFEEALFPGYVFGKFPFSTHSRLVASSMGISNIVGFGGRPSTVDQSVIESLRHFVSDNEVVVIAPQILPGDEVKVIDGPFKGLQALVTRMMPAKERVAVLLDLLGAQREVEITMDRIVSAKVHPLSERAAG